MDGEQASVCGTGVEPVANELALADQMRTTNPRMVGVARAMWRARHILIWERDEGGPLKLVSTPAKNVSEEEYLTALHRMADEFEAEEHCYFVGGNEGPVKIGCTSDLKKRLMNLQNASPVKLRLLASINGGQSRETAYHIMFAAHRLHGEWFERCPEIEAEIERLTERLNV